MNRDNPRRVALEILLRIDRERSYAHILIDRELSAGGLQGPDRGLLTELVYGVLRRRATLDHILGQFAKGGVGRLEQVVLTLLRLGLYQSLFLDRVPVSAAVNETVKLAKVYAPRAAAFVNAVLRRADRERDGVRWPDRVEDPAGFLAARHSHPQWLVEEWLRLLGGSEAEALAEVMSLPAPLSIRTNTLKIDREALMERLAAEGVAAEAARHSPVGVRLLSHVNPATLSSFREGLFTVQDESSQMASVFLAPGPGETVLDACAAPGGKTTHLAQLMEDRGSILACDIHGSKLRLIAESAARLGVSIVRTEAMDMARPDDRLPERGFDRILVDAPCSGLGVIRRNPEAKWWKTPADVARLAALQRRLLGSLAERLRDGGVLLYSTCSTATEENEAVIDDFLTDRGDFMVEDLRELFPERAALCTERGFFRSWPHRHSMDGFFAARLRRYERK